MQVDTVPLAGQPAQAVTESGSGASMLVLGAQGTGVFGPMALGPVSRHAAAHASCLVVVVRGETAAVHQQVGIGIGHRDTRGLAYLRVRGSQPAQGQPGRRPRLAHTANRHLASRFTVA